MRTVILPMYLVMPPQAGLLAGFASGLLSMRRYLGLHRPEQWVDILDLSAIDETEISAALAPIELMASAARLAAERLAEFLKLP